MIFRTA